MHFVLATLFFSYPIQCMPSNMWSAEFGSNHDYLTRKALKNEARNILNGEFYVLKGLYNLEAVNTSLTGVFDKLNRCIEESKRKEMFLLGNHTRSIVRFNFCIHTDSSDQENTFQFFKMLSPAVYCEIVNRYSQIFFAELPPSLHGRSSPSEDPLAVRHANINLLSLRPHFKPLEIEKNCTLQRATLQLSELTPETLHHFAQQHDIQYVQQSTTPTDRRTFNFAWRLNNMSNKIFLNRIFDAKPKKRTTESDDAGPPPITCNPA